jgi:hypothetical protein
MAVVRVRLTEAARAGKARAVREAGRTRAGKEESMMTDIPEIRTAHWDVQAAWQVRIAGRHVATVVLREREVRAFRELLEDKSAELVLEAWARGTLPW